MSLTLLHALHALWITTAAMLVLATFLSVLPRALSPAFCRAPVLDVVVASLTWAPWVVSACVWGWAGFAGTLVGQFVALYVWAKGHELAHPSANRGPRIVKFINAAVGRWQNHLALWVTLIALPAFWAIRIIQITMWWTLVVLLDFPRYDQSEWVNVSRQKFEGLVGHDLIWCLYCDWMTGVYSMGAEMLRNVESFWCPIRFYNGKKCENCAVDFPDINNGWINDGTMADVVSKMEEMYTEGPRTWFGHPARRVDVTINGKPQEGITSAQPEPVVSAADK